MDARAISILARLEGLQLRAFWRLARRDPVFVLAVVCVGAVILAGVRKAAGGLAHGAPAVGMLFALAAGLIAARLLFPRGGSKVREALASGPLHELACEPRPLATWLLVRTLSLSLAADLILSLAAASAAPLAGLVLLVAFALGALAWSLIEARQILRPMGLAVSSQPSRPAPRERTSPRSAPLILARLALIAPRRGVPAGLAAASLLILGAVSAALAAHNNDSPSLAIGLGVCAAAVAGACLSPTGALVPALRREPMSLPVLYLWLYLPCLVFALGGGAACGLAAGLGARGAGEIAIGAGVVTLVVSVMFYLHQLTRSPKMAPLGLGADLFGGLVLAGIETSLAFLWTFGRGAWLLRRARRVRWLDQ